MTLLVVQKVIFVKSKDVPVGTLIHVCFERGEHSESTGDYAVSIFEDGNAGAVIDETLTLACTMYRDNAGKFQVLIHFLYSCRHKLDVFRRRKASCCCCNV